MRFIPPFVYSGPGKVICIPPLYSPSFIFSVIECDQYHHSTKHKISNNHMLKSYIIVKNSLPLLNVRLYILRCTVLSTIYSYSLINRQHYGYS